MEIANKKFTRFLLGVTLVVYLFLVVFGVSQTIMGMEKRADGSMSDCLFSSKAEICTMTFSEHLSQWKAMFTTTAPQEAFTFALLILIAVVFIAVAIFKRNLFLLSSYFAIRWRLYIRQNPNLSLFSSIKEAFSSGILHPKIF